MRWDLSVRSAANGYIVSNRRFHPNSEKISSGSIWIREWVAVDSSTLKELLLEIADQYVQEREHLRDLGAEDGYTKESDYDYPK